ncbi:DHS-like NAD/FAD-binding protein [Glarea lozoyensis ATCC 20868]|uniref:DHS-like NAD/FAD-binding protein n=1 Tax=Glarea lozoyensis (strain ATCC 20868 / MF5171) TaxID=1116229 RepID=S3E0J4_GLAL2|nr:DHS-like NAD/FAD-binding protein [Glarea lozoyensis ATCC 20868]EPE32058.1 DHS-like NAD/FAD-binding protein [Glarea lozoyensis ATCC 20868]
MGQENSTQQIDPNTPPHTLQSRTIEGVASFIKDVAPKKIVVMTGAGISTSAGIPDFRSPDTGLYANLARLDLPYAEAVFDISYFRQNPNPFYVLAKELYPGKFFPTISHSFVALLQEKGLLKMLFTQNIDCLERRAGVEAGRVVEAHGSFASQRCIECKTEFPEKEMLELVMKGEVPHCVVPQCNGLVKPDIVFFGEPLPESFHSNRHVAAEADLVIVMGTSLSVHPFASLPQFAREGVPRVLINKEQVGDFGSRLDDVVVLSDCDDGVRKLADALGWGDELEAMWLEVNGKVKGKDAERLKEMRKNMTKDELLQEEIDKLTKGVDDLLHDSKEHVERTTRQFEKSTPTESNSSTVDTPNSDTESPKETTKSESSYSVPAKPAPEKENEPLNMEKTVNGQPASPPQIRPEAILDTTLPHNKPGDGSSL